MLCIYARRSWDSICVFGTNMDFVVVVVLLTVSAASNVNNRLHFIIEHVFRRNGKKKTFLLFGPTFINELL